MEETMIKILVTIALALSLVSFAPIPAPRPIVHRTYLAIPQRAPVAQACTYETAPAKLRAEIADPLGIPYGSVTAWSCDGDGLAVAAELAQRAAAMHADAAAYRAAHPIGGVR
jgi:hypothetical protein